MKRREFNSMMMGSAAASVLGHLRWPSGAVGVPEVRRAAQAGLRVDAGRVNAHIAALSEFGKNPAGGVSRVAYSEADKAARSVVIDWMKAARLEPAIDLAGNIIGRRAGRENTLKPLLFGSHIDSVPEGGNYDGDVGVTSAIEVAQTLAEQGVTTRHPIQVVVWQNEEGGLIGSRAVSGQLAASELANVTSSGKTIRDGITFIGGDPLRLGEVRRAKGDIAGYFELHIEQGGTLEKTKTDIGVVQGIVGIKQWDVTITGVQNHAGTTEMDNRHDALLSAARYVEMVNRVVRSTPGRQVGTVGRIQAFPGAINVIPGKVVCSLELRDLDDAKIDAMFARIQSEVKKIGAMNGTTFAFTPIHENVSAPSDTRMRGFISQAASSLGLSTRAMPSGAGHDAQAMATLGPMGMIFIPSIGGISHSPREFSTPHDIGNGANVLLDAVLAADAALG
jgi:beta-ureidopropionase / N-carbamoyl-L-amino-acid hydrolase